MRSILSEKNIVILLFALVLITVSLAIEDGKKFVQQKSERSSSLGHSVSPFLQNNPTNITEVITEQTLNP